jgi:hypothetical protein
MTLPPLPISSTLLPRGSYMLTDTLVQALTKSNALPGPIEFPMETGRWLQLPGGTFLSVREDDEHQRLIATHTLGDRPDTDCFDADQILLDRYLDG